MANPVSRATSIRLTNGGPLDSWEGPYVSIAAACAAIPNEVDGDGVNFRLGKKPLIRIDGKLVPYWWPNGSYGNDDLIKYIPEPDLTDYAKQTDVDQLNVKTKAAQDGIVYASNGTHKTGWISDDDRLFAGITLDDKFDAPGGLSDELYHQIENKVSPNISSNILTQVSEAISDIEKDTLAEIGYSVIRNNKYKVGQITGDDKILWGITLDDKFDAPGGLSEELIQLIRSKIAAGEISDLVSWFGDSLTNNGTAVARLQALLGSKYVVANEGVGGETVSSICARIGSVPARIVNGFTLPADKSPVTIATFASPLTNFKYNRSVTPLRQSVSSRINPVHIQGVECTIKWTGASSSDPAGVWTIERNVVGENDLYVQPNSFILPVGARKYKHVRAAVYWMGQNGGYDTPAQLVEYIRANAEYQGTSDYIVVGLHTGTPASRAELEDTMRREFGLRYINLREYISKYGLRDAGITPTQADLDAQDAGTFPPAFWSSETDSVHMNAAGYTLVGNQVYQRMIQLGMF